MSGKALAQQQQNSKQQQAEQEAAKKAQEEAKAKFAAMKGHFDAGNMALDQAKGIRAQMEARAKAAQQG